MFATTWVNYLITKKYIFWLPWVRDSVDNLDLRGLMRHCFTLKVTLAGYDAEKCCKGRQRFCSQTEDQWSCEWPFLKDLAKFSVINRLAQMPFLPLKHLLLCSIRCLKSGGFKAWINYSLNHLNISILWLYIFVNTSLHNMHSPPPLPQCLSGS